MDERVDAFRELVYRAIRLADEKGKPLRGYDGTVSLQWPPLVHTHSSNRFYSLRLSCSVLGGATAHYSWRGRTWRSVFDHAMADVERWIADLDAEDEDKGGDAP